jgi:hypothetical protein
MSKDNSDSIAKEERRRSTVYDFMQRLCISQGDQGTTFAVDVDGNDLDDTLSFLPNTPTSPPSYKTREDSANSLLQKSSCNASPYEYDHSEIEFDVSVEEESSPEASSPLTSDPDTKSDNCLSAISSPQSISSGTKGDELRLELNLKEPLPPTPQATKATPRDTRVRSKSM